MAKYLGLLLLGFCVCGPVTAKESDVSDLLSAHEANLMLLKTLLTGEGIENLKPQIYTNLMVGWATYASFVDSHNLKTDMYSTKRICELEAITAETFPEIQNAKSRPYPAAMISFAHAEGLKAIGRIKSNNQIDCKAYFEAMEDIKGKLNELQ